MKAFKFILGGVILVCLIFIGLLIKEISNSSRLKEEKQNKERTIVESTSAKRKLKKLEQDISEMQKEVVHAQEMVLADDLSVLQMIKDISRLGYASNFKKIEFNYMGSGSVFAGGLGATAPRWKAIKKARAILLEMKSESDFPNLNEFLTKLYMLTGIVSVEGMSIERDPSIVPRQKVTLILAIYRY